MTIRLSALVPTVRISVVLVVAAFVPMGTAQGQSSVEAAVQMLIAGQLDEGKAALVDAATSLPPSEATRLLRMAQTLGGVGPVAKPVVARSIVLVQRDSVNQALAVLSREAPAAEEREPGEGATLMLFAAHIAEDSAAEGESDPARELYATVVADYRDAPAWAEAVLRLAMLRLEAGEELDLAATDVEDMIVERPTHPLVPTARRLLARIQEALGA